MASLALDALWISTNVKAVLVKTVQRAGMPWPLTCASALMASQKAPAPQTSTSARINPVKTKAHAPTVLAVSANSAVLVMSEKSALNQLADVCQIHATTMARAS